MTSGRRSGGPDLWPAGRNQPYANHLEISFSLSDVELCFAQNFGPDMPMVPQSWVRTSPVHLASFGQAISRAIAGYEGQYGRIPGRPNDAPGLKQ
jgi:hypothetical protein